jgi:hypothetical protein
LGKSDYNARTGCPRLANPFKGAETKVSVSFFILFLKKDEKGIVFANKHVIRYFYQLEKGTCS